MTSVLVVVFGIIATALSGVASNIYSATAVSGLLSIYLILLVLDLRKVAALDVSRAINAGFLWTTFGVAVNEKVSALLEKIKTFGWQSDQLRALTNGVKGDRLFKEIVVDSNWREEGITDLASRAARYAKARTKADGVAVYFNREKQFNATATVGVEGKRFTELLRRVAERVAASVIVETDLSAFRSFGFSTSLVHRCHDKNGDVGILWLGFSSSHAPSNTDEKIAEELAIALTDEVRYADRLQELAVPRPGEPSSSMDEIVKFSHDIRSPLNNVKAILALLKLEELRSESSELLDVALSNCRGLEAVVEDVIDFSRHRSGKLSQRRETTDLRELLEEVIDGYRVAAKMKGLQIALELSLEPKYALVDRNQIRRVITNLVSNALKYTRYGSVAITLREISGTVEISVRDSGVGIAAAQLSELFTPFTRFNPEDADGIGLGLSIAKILVEGNLGRIEVHSQVGVGSEFIIYLPAHKLEVAPAREQSAVCPRPSMEVNATILIVDDNVDAVRSLARLLERDGFSVLKSVTVHEALDVLNFEAPDLIITDAEMPHGGGRKILSAAASSTTAFPVIVLTGNAHRAQELKAVGATTVLEKPCDYDKLRAVIDDLLRPISSAVTA